MKGWCAARRPSGAYAILPTPPPTVCASPDGGRPLSRRGVHERGPYALWQGGVGHANTARVGRGVGHGGCLAQNFSTEVATGPRANQRGCRNNFRHTTM